MVLDFFVAFRFRSQYSDELFFCKYPKIVSDFYIISDRYSNRKLFFPITKCFAPGDPGRLASINAQHQANLALATEDSFSSSDFDGIGLGVQRPHSPQYSSDTPTGSSPTPASTTSGLSLGKN